MHVALRPETADREIRMRAVQTQIRRETGVWITNEEAYEELSRRDAVGEPIDGDAKLTPKDLIPLKTFLQSRGYDPLAIDTAVSDAGRHGSLWCSAVVEFEDLEEAEKLVPGVTPYQWAPEYGDVYDDDKFGGSKGYRGLAIRGVCR